MVGTTVVTFLHLLATVFWVGGMLYFHFILHPSLHLLDPPQVGKLMHFQMKRFAMMAWLSIIVLMVTGVMMTPSGWFFNFSSLISTALALKHIFFLIMLLIGIFISLVYGPKMDRLEPKPGEHPSAEFFRTQHVVNLLTRTNLVLGILVLICIAIG